MNYLDAIGFTEEHKRAFDQLDERLFDFSKTLVDVHRPSIQLVGTGGERWCLEVFFSVSGMDDGFSFNILPDELARASREKAVIDFFFNNCADFIEHKAALAFYKKNYECIFNYHFDQGEVCLPAESGTCRFCLKTKPEVSFKKIAHAIPQSTGNLGLISKRECDACNHTFGRTIEDNFGDFTNWQRALFRIGSKKVPVFERGGTKIRVVDEETEIILGKDGVAQLNDDMSGLIISMKNKGYTPAAVMLAFYKMAYTVMPENELKNFAHLRNWLLDPTFKQGCHYPLLMAHSPAEVFGPVSCLLLRRKNDDLEKPYLTLVILMGAVAYQVIIPPTSEQKQAHECRLMLLANSYPSKIERHALLSMHGTEKVQGQAISFTAAFVEDERARLANLPQVIQDQLKGH